MARTGAPRTGLEGFKFGLYVGVPISLYIFVAYFPEGLDYFVRKFKYVTYPPAGEEGIAHKLQVEAEERRKSQGND